MRNCTKMRPLRRLRIIFLPYIFPSKVVTTASMTPRRLVNLAPLVLSLLAGASLLRSTETNKEIDALINQAAETFEKGRREEAFTLCTKAIELDAKSVRALYVRGRFYALDRQVEKALADYDSALKLDPGSALIYQQRGTERFKLGRIEEALSDFDEYIRLVPDEAANHWQRGIACYYA